MCELRGMMLLMAQRVLRSIGPCSCFSHVLFISLGLHSNKPHLNTFNASPFYSFTPKIITQYAQCTNKGSAARGTQKVPRQARSLRAHIIARRLANTSGRINLARYVPHDPVYPYNRKDAANKHISHLYPYIKCLFIACLCSENGVARDSFISHS